MTDFIAKIIMVLACVGTLAQTAALLIFFMLLAPLAIFLAAASVLALSTLATGRGFRTFLSAACAFTFLIVIIISVIAYAWEVVRSCKVVILCCQHIVVHVHSTTILTIWGQVDAIGRLVRIFASFSSLLRKIQLMAFKSLLVRIESLGRLLSLSLLFFLLACNLLQFAVALLLCLTLTLKSLFKLLLLLLLVVHQVELRVGQHLIKVRQALVCHSAHLSVRLVG